MAITTILGTDLPSDSRTVINDNFSDLDTTKADLASPTFTGTPSLPTGTTAVTQSASDNSTAVATTAYADAATANAFVGARVYAGGATSINSGAVIAFNSENFDTDGFHDTVTNNSRITIPVGLAGKYLIGGSFIASNSNNNSAQIRLNGTSIVQSGSQPYTTADGGNALSTVYELAEGDYVELWGRGGSMSASAGEATHLFVTKLD